MVIRLSFDSFSCLYLTSGMINVEMLTSQQNITI